MHILTCFLKNLPTIVHFLTTNLQKRIRLLKQWNNKKLIRTWVLLHQIVAYLLAFQHTSPKKNFVVCNKEILKIANYYFVSNFFHLLIVSYFPYIFFFFFSFFLLIFFFPIFFIFFGKKNDDDEDDDDELQAYCCHLQLKAT